MTLARMRIWCGKCDKCGKWPKCDKCGVCGKCGDCDKCDDCGKCGKCGNCGKCDDCGKCLDCFLKKHKFDPLPKKRERNASKWVFRIGYAALATFLAIAVLLTGDFLYILDCALVCVAQIVRLIVHRSLLAISETRYKKGRYKNKTEMIKKCFSGIDWLNVLVFYTCSVFVIVCLQLLADSNITGKQIFKMFSAIGFGTMLANFALNGQSAVEHSIVAEDNQMHLAITLADRYWLDRVEDICTVLKRTFWEQDHALSSTKLFILFPFTCDGRDPEHIDRKIKRVDTPELPENLKGKNIPVYRIGSFTVMLELAPLSTLHKMSKRKKYQAVDKNNIREHVKLFCRRMKECLEDFGKHANCVLIPYDDEASSSGLASFLETFVFPDYKEGNEDNFPRDGDDGDDDGNDGGNAHHGAGSGGPGDGEGSRSLGKPKDSVSSNDRFVVQIEESAHVGAGPHVGVAAGRRSHTGPHVDADTNDDGDLSEDIVAVDSLGVGFITFTL